MIYLIVSHDMGCEMCALCCSRISQSSSGYPVRDPEPQAQVARVGVHEPFGIMASASGTRHEETL